MKKIIKKKSVKKTAVKKSATRKTVAAAFKGFSPAAFARGCGLTRQGVMDGIASNRIKVNTSGLIVPDDNARFLTQKMRLGIRQEILDSITNKKIISAIKSHFTKIISTARIKAEQAERLQIELSEMKAGLAPVEMLRGLFVFFSDFKNRIEVLRDKTIQEKISEMMTSRKDQEREAVQYIKTELEKIIKKLYDELVERINAGGGETPPEKNKKKSSESDHEFSESEIDASKSKDITVLIEQAGRASMDLQIASDVLKSIQSTKEQLLTYLKKQVITDYSLVEYYYSYLERLCAQVYGRPYEIAPILKTYYMANDLVAAASHLIREIAATADQIKKEVLTEMANDGFQLKNIPYNVE